MCAGSPQLANRVAVWELVAQSIKMRVCRYSWGPLAA